MNEILSQLKTKMAWLPFDLSNIFSSSTAFICAVLAVLGVGLLCYAFFGGIAKIEMEKRSFQKMILSPCDSSVKAYIKAFKKTCGPLSFVYHIYLPLSYYSHVKRRASGWDAISKNPNVSETLKTELKNTFIARGNNKIIFI